jgi:hypothetical protein
VYRQHRSINAQHLLVVSLLFVKVRLVDLLLVLALRRLRGHRQWQERIIATGIAMLLAVLLVVVKQQLFNI